MYDPTGYYSIGGKPPQPASFHFQRSKLLISVQDEGGASKTVHWYYDAILKEPTVEKTYKYTEFPPQYIQLRSGDFSAELESRMMKRKGAFLSRKGSVLLKILGAFLVFILLIYFFVLPWLAGIVANRIPISYERSLGDQMFASMKPSLQIDERKTAYANDFFDQLHFRSQYPVQITVVKSDVANAFAIPGGHIVVYDKILKGMTSPEEFAALLSHEFTHVEKRHSLRSVVRQLGAAIFISMLVGDINSIGAVLISNADNLQSLHYSRRLEKEADDYGVQLLSERKIDCSGFVRLFQLLKKESTTEVSEWISSHPDLNKRIKNIQQNTLCTRNAAFNTTLQDLFQQIKTP